MGARLIRGQETLARRWFGWRGKETGSGNMADSREVMNIRQASNYLGVSPDTLYKYVGEQKIAEDSCFQAGQPLALQEIETGPVDGREVEPDGSGYEA